jgi:hypothetical protein
MGARRLGDLDPFTWIRDTRDDILVEKALTATSPRIGTDSKMDIHAEPLIHTRSELPVEVTVSFGEIKGQRIITVEVNKEGHPPAKINLKA